MRTLEIIKSKNNNLIKHIKKLRLKKYREDNREFIIEGLRFVEEAVLADAPVVYCLFSGVQTGDRIYSLMEALNCKKVRMYEVDESLFKDICETKNPQGIVAVVEKIENDASNMLKDWDFVILVDRIQDPGNLGTIIRTADAAGVNAVYISEGTVDPYSSKVLRSTMGSIFHLPLIQCADMPYLIEELKKEGFKIFASSLECSFPYYNEDYTQKTALVIGNEANGVSSTILESADFLLKIPMPGRAESLNAGVAGGILMFEVVKQRSVDK